jgi:hypothetical protein
LQAFVVGRASHREAALINVWVPGRLQGVGADRLVISGGVGQHLAVEASSAIEIAKYTLLTDIKAARKASGFS